VHSIRSTFPKFDSSRNDSVSAPVRWARHIAVAGKAVIGVGKLLLERIA
jgi:hypothetical protein